MAYLIKKEIAMNKPCQMTDLLSLFRRCLYATYLHAGRAADYAVQRRGRTLYLLFEHSNGSEDWKSNLNFPARAYQNGNACWYVHRGFLTVWKSVRDEVEAAVAAIIAAQPIDEIVCIGYSHGAALCGLATEDMAFLYGDRLSVCGYGFGCPRFVFGVLPAATRRRFERFTVIRNRPDAVTYLPPAWLGYHHVGTLREIGKKGVYSPIDAHRPEAYIAELAKK
jgi:hypothetical protein